MAAKNVDGIFLENVDGDQLQYLIHWLRKMDDPTYVKHKAYPKELDRVLELFKVADFYDLPHIKDQIIEEIANNYSFIRHTNVRRLVFEFLDEEMSLELLAYPQLPIQILCFILTDPSITFRNTDGEHVQIPPSLFKDIFLQRYKKFTEDRIILLDIDKQYEKDGVEFRGVLYDEDVMFLTKPYHDCYSDS